VCVIQVWLIIEMDTAATWFRVLRETAQKVPFRCSGRYFYTNLLIRTWRSVPFWLHHWVMLTSCLFVVHEHFSPLRYETMKPGGSSLTFEKDVVLPSSGWKNKPGKWLARSWKPMIPVDAPFSLVTCLAYLPPWGCKTYVLQKCVQFHLKVRWF
jgi:hypothetical protein